MTYAEIEQGEKIEHYAIYVRDTACLIRGSNTFKDIFSFIDWIQGKEEGQPPPTATEVISEGFDYLSPSTRVSSKNGDREKEEEETEVVDTAFNPDEAPLGVAHVVAGNDFDSEFEKGEEDENGGMVVGIPWKEEDSGVCTDETNLKSIQENINKNLNKREAENIIYFEDEEGEEKKKNN